MKNCSVRWYTDGINPRKQSEIGGRLYNPIIIGKGVEANKIRAYFRRIESDDNIESFYFGTVPLKIYNTEENVTMIFYHDQNDISVQLASRSLGLIMNTAERIGLPLSEIQKMIGNK